MVDSWQGDLQHFYTRLIEEEVGGGNIWSGIGEYPPPGGICTGQPNIIQGIITAEATGTDSVRNKHEQHREEGKTQKRRKNTSRGRKNRRMEVGSRRKGNNTEGMEENQEIKAVKKDREAGKGWQKRNRI